MASKLLITGASGHLGQRVLHHLLHSLNIPAQQIIAATRSPDSLASFATLGVEIRAADFDDPASLPAVFNGAGRVLLISTNTPGDRSAQHRQAIAAAIQAGVKHVIYTSIPNPADPSLHIVRDHAATEKALAESKLPGWTVLRNNWYFENLLWTVPDMLQTGQWFSATGDGAIAWISRDDLARAAATVLAGNSSGRTTLTLGGTRAYTAPQLAGLLSTIFSKPITVVSVSSEELAKSMEAHGMPAPMASLLASGDAHIAAGRLATITNDYRQLTGLEPIAFEDWLATLPAILKQSTP